MSSGAATRADWRNVDQVSLTPILAGALDAFYDHGFHGTTVRDIAGRVGVTVPALYYHFQNKEDIFLSLLKLATEDIAWRVEAAIADAEGDPAVALTNATEAVVLHMTVRNKLATLDADSRYLSEENRAEYAAIRRRVEQSVTDVVKEGVSNGVFRTEDHREAARALLGMWQFIARWYRTDGSATPHEITRRYVTLSLATVGHTGD